MYRVLGADGGTLERRNQRVRPGYSEPELLAIVPNLDVLKQLRG